MIENNPLPLISIEQVDKDNLFKWRETIQGSKGTPFEGGTFKVDIIIPGDYPLSQPTVRFISEMFHPNIYKDGIVSIRTLVRANWNVGMTIKGVLLSIQRLLDGHINPNRKL